MSLKNIGNSLSVFGEGEKIKGFISSLKEYSSFLDSINAKSLKGLKSLSRAFSIFSENKELSQATQSLKTLLGMMDGFSGKKKELDEIGKTLEGLSDKSKIAALGFFDFNEEQLKTILIASGMDAELAKTTASTIASGTAATGASVGFKALGASIANAAKGLVAFFTTNPVGWLILATGAVIGLAKAGEYLSESFDRSVEKANESRQAYENASSDLSSIKSELETTADRIKELESMGSLSLTEEAELNTLKEQNAELERKLRISQQIADAKGREAAKDANDVLMGKNQYNAYVVSKWNPETNNYVSAGIKEFGSYGTVLDQTKSYINSFNKLKELKTEAEKKLATFKPDSKEYSIQNEQIKKIDEQMQKIEVDISTNISTIQDNYDSLLDSSGNIRSEYAETGKAVQELFDMWTTGTDKAAEKVEKINGILAKSDFSKVKSSLVNAAKDQDKDTFAKTVSEIDGLQEALKNAGISTEDFQQQLASIGRQDFSGTKKHIEDLEKKLGNQDWAKSFFSDKDYDDIDTFYQYIKNKQIDISGWTEEDLKFNWEIALTGDKEAIKSIDDLKTSLSETKEFVSDLSSAISESASSTGLSADAMAKVKSAFSGLDGYDAEKLFQTTSYGIKLNRTELEALNKEYRKNKAADYQRTVNDLSQQYVEATEKLKGLKETDSGYQEQLATAKGLKEQLMQARQLQSQFEGLTSAYNDFVLATSQSNDRDAYENIGKSYESMKKILNSGWYGDQSLNKYLDLLLDDTERTGNAITDFGKLTEKIKGTNFSIMDFFTLNDDGDATVDGIYNLIDAIREKFGSAADEIVKKNEKGGYSFDLTSKNIAKVSDALGISEEAIHKLLEAMPDAGWDCQFGDAAEKVETLKEKADEAAAALKKLDGGDKLVESYKLNVDTNDVDGEITKAKGYLSQINGSKASVEVKSAETNYVEAQLDVLIQKKNELSRPAYMKLNIEQVATGAQDMLKKLQEYQYALETVNGLELKGKTDTKEYTDAKDKLNGIADEIFKLSESSDIDFGIDVNSDNYETFKKKVQEGKINVPLAGDTDQLKDSVSKAIQTAIDGINITFKGLFGKEKTITIKANVDGKEDVDNLNKSVNETPNEKSTNINNNADEAKTKVDNYSDSVKNAPSEKNTNITNTADEAKNKTENYKQSLNGMPQNKHTQFTTNAGSVGRDVSVLSSLLNGISGTYSVVISIVKRITEWVTSKIKGNGENGAGGVDGTAHVNGTAFARGNWGTRTSGTALGGELGQELIVRGGRFFTIGDEGAEFFNFQKGDIIFNADQTKQIFEKGKIVHGKKRGQALVEGTAFETGATGSSQYDRPKNTGSHSAGSSSNSSSSSSSKSSSSKSSSSSSEDQPKDFDWIEIAINRIEKAIDRLKTTATSTYKALNPKLAATYSQITKVNQEIGMQQKAYNRYMQQANSVGLSSSLAAKVRDGTIDINKYNSETQELITSYKNWYDKAIACSEAIQKLHESLASLYKDNFDNIEKDFESRLALLEHATKTYNNGISELEELGYVKSKEYYSAMLDIQKRNEQELQKELNDLTNAFSEAMASGEVQAYSETWYDFQNSINGVKEKLQETNTEMITLSKTMRSIDWERFDMVQDRISEITDESDFLIDLMSNSKLHDDKGQMTDEGMATLGLHGSNYNVYMAQADKYAKEISKINQDIANDPYDTKLLDRKKELVELQQQSILNAEKEKQAMIDLAKDGIDAQLSSLKKLIDAYTDSLDKAKDLYDYQKQVNEKTSEISSLKKQINAYAGDDSEENKSRIQKLKNDLKTAEDDLQETEYDKFVDDQKAMLDELYNQYEITLNQRLDNLDALISDMISTINDNSSSISDTISTASENVGYTLSDNMQSIWEGSISGVVTEYGDGFNEKLTSINAVLASIQLSVDSLAHKSDAKAKSTTSKTTITTKPKNNTSNNKPNNNNNNNNNNQKKKITNGSKINAKGAFIYSDSYGGGKQKQYYSKDPVYVVIGENNGYYKVRHHSLKSGVTGWFKKGDVKAYAHGGLADYTGYAWVDGTKKRPEAFLDATDTKNVSNLTEALRVASKSNIYPIGSTYSAKYSKAIPHNITDISALITRATNEVPSNNQTFGDINVTIPIERVNDYNDFVNQLKKDDKFANMIRSETIDLVRGGSKLAKNKYTWK